jgi:phenylpropionate dioxygenase-like ring-hydroxylating dioxygenase large terminal subunit
MLVSDLPALRDYWYPVAYSSEIDTEPFAAQLFSEPYVFWRPSEHGPALGARDRCPHRSARLSQGWVADGCLVCPYHGWRYDPLGTCLLVPAQDPSVPIPRRARLSSVSVQERYGLVWACLGEPHVDVPVLKELDEGYTLIHELKDVWNASAPRMIDNALDVSHVAFVHRGTVGDPDHPQLSDFSVERDGLRIRFSITYESRVTGRQAANVGLAEGIVTRRTDAELVQPFVFRGVLSYENGLRHVLYKTCTPVDDHTTLFFQFIGRNDSPDPERWEDITAVDRAVQAEDRLLLEGVDPDYPLELSAEVHTKVDRMTVEYRRVLTELAELGRARPVASSQPRGEEGAA